MKLTETGRMINLITKATGIAATVLLCLGLALAAQQAQKPATPGPAAQAQSIMASTAPTVLVKKTVDNELHERNDGHFMYRDWRKTPDGSKTKEMIETNQGMVARLIAVNDQPLTPEQQSAERARLQNLLSHPDVQAQKKKEQDQDADRVKRMFKELPNAFVYEYAGVEQGGSGELIHLKFKPNPNFNPPSRETSVFRAMAGDMWVSVPDLRLAKIEATLFKEISFGWGILGHLDKGGHFFVSQTKVGTDRWEATDMNIQFTGKALLFKTINLKQIEKLSDFRQVPDNLTLAQAIDMLNKNGNQVAENANGK